MSEKKQAAALLMGPLVHLLHERGLDGDAILRRHGLDPQMVQDPEARLDAAVSNTSSPSRNRLSALCCEPSTKP